MPAPRLDVAARAHSSHDVMIAPAHAQDLPALLALLRQAGLPERGVADRFPEAYVVARDGAVVGAAGLERHGGFGLLRSVVVAPTHQGRGIARALVQDRLEAARAGGLAATYLLTTTAPAFFAALGFTPIPREAAPPPVRASDEFAQVCPASALCMTRVG